MNELPQVVFNSLLSGVHRTPEPVPLPANIIRLDRNERVGPYPREVAEAIFSRLTAASISNYPDTTALYRALTRHTSLPRERLLLVPGSCDPSSTRARLRSAWRSSHHAGSSYQMYPVYARMFGACPCKSFALI